MKTNVDGLILKELNYGENDGIITVLTKEQGIVSCYARGVRNIKHPSFAATKQLTFSRLTLFQGKGMYIIDEAKTIRSFYNLSSDLEKYALSQYFSELVIKTTPENVPSEGQLELLLNCLHLLMEGSKSCEMIKAIFELRLALISGGMPGVLFCSECGKYDDDEMFFDYEENKLYCSECFKGSDTVCRLSSGALRAMRFILLSEPKKLFSFTISKASLDQLSECAEKYMTCLVGSKINTLAYYYQIKSLL